MTDGAPQGNIDNVADCLVDKAIERHSTDNISGVVIGLTPSARWTRTDATEEEF